MHQFPELFARSWTAIVIAALGILQLVSPGWFRASGAFGNDLDVFACRARSLPAAERDRVQRVLDARAEAEGVSPNSMRWLGLFGIAMAPLEFVPAIQFAIPYALYCLATSVAAYLRYSKIRRATERRAAPLVVRRASDAMSPGSVVAMLGCFVAVVLFGVDPSFRIGAIAVGISMLVLMWVAWSIANSRALMLGDDPQLEYVVDERLRALRVNATVALACAPAVVLIGMTSPWIAPAYAAYGRAAFILSYASFAFAMVWIGVIERRFGKKLLNHA